MEEKNLFKNSQIIVLGICIATATIVSSVILSQGFLKVMRFTREQISVTGAAQQVITSDYMVWSSSFGRRDLTLKDAFKGLQADLETVRAYLLEKGIKEDEIFNSPVTTQTLYKKTSKGSETNDIEAYRVSQAVEVRSYNVDKVTDIYRDSTELIEKGVEYETYSPQYFYTKLDELKIEMLAKATENAKARAENMVHATGNKIGFMRAARMGVFQITSVNSTDVSDYGVNDTSSLEKKVTAVVNVSFAIE
ncbi:MAG: SIMPL domain-containing protein [Candidatus Omnitrophica bacterium]|jgi:hypothetical protein|nr:SIMPL domain-containing protein [Candidatus Omnitrophota bacterium]